MRREDLILLIDDLLCRAISTNSFQKKLNDRLLKFYQQKLKELDDE